MGLFLRTRREAISPARVGLPAGPRRRTPGLRRSELATLAGMSVEYLIRLEQGRDRHPSAQVLSAIADALQLTPSERIHLHVLTKSADPGYDCMGGAQPNREVRPTVRAVLDQLEPAPAIVIDRPGDILASTDCYRRVMRETGLFDETDQPNFPRFVFGDPRAREIYRDWSTVADDVVASLKHGPFRTDPSLTMLVDELTVVAGEEFTRRIATVPNLPPSVGVTRLAHPSAGDLRLAYETLTFGEDIDQRLLVYLPADAATAVALDTLSGRRPGALRAVPG